MSNNYMQWSTPSGNVQLVIPSGMTLEEFDEAACALTIQLSALRRIIVARENENIADQAHATKTKEPA